MTKRLQRYAVRAGCLLVANLGLAVGGCADSLASSDAVQTVSAVPSGTVMVSVRDANGRTVSTLPYTIEPGRSGVSIAGLLLGKKGNRSLSDRSRPPEACPESCTAAGPQVSWLPGSPAAIIKRVLQLLHDQKTVTRAALDTGADAVSSGTAADLFVGIQTENYPCEINGDTIPSDLLAPLCRGRRLIQKVTIGGQPMLLRDGKGVAGGAAIDEQYWYRFDQLLAESKQLAIPLIDVTAAFDEGWTYHFPRVTRQYKMGTCSSCLAVAFVGAGRNPAGARVDVISINIYY